MTLITVATIWLAATIAIGAFILAVLRASARADRQRGRAQADLREPLRPLAQRSRLRA